MTRYVLAALLGVALVAALGYVVYSRTIATEGQRAVPDLAPPRAPAVIAEAATDTERPGTTKVVAIRGVVERRAGAQWVALKEGDQLTTQDTIRTGVDASATLDGGVVVEVDDRTELTVGEISASISQLALTEGRVTANAGTAGGPKIRISTRDTDAVAETDAGRFDVLSSGTGQVTVAAREGEVSLTAKGTTVRVPAGRLSTVTAGQAPTAPAVIPTSLFLKVSTAATSKDTTALRGETTPGAVVSINGVRTVATADGRFSSEVPARKGENTIIVQVEDALGRRERKVIPRAVAKAPRLDTQVEWE